MTKTAIDVVKDMQNAWETLDWDKVTSLFSDDGSLVIVPARHTYTGHQQIRSHLDQVASGIEELSFDIVHLDAVGNVVTFERADVFVYNGKSARVPVVGILEIEAGKVKTWREYFDGYTMQKAMA